MTRSTKCLNAWHAVLSAGVMELGLDVGVCTRMCGCSSNMSCLRSKDTESCARGPESREPGSLRLLLPRPPPEAVEQAQLCGQPEKR